MRLSTHFTLSEMTKSAYALRHGIDNSLDPDCPKDAEIIENLRRVCEHVLEPARAHFGKPIIPSSGYRSPALNVGVNGSPVSRHMRGYAVDFEIPGVRNIDLARWLSKNLDDYDQIILAYWDPADGSAGWVHAAVLLSGNRKELRTMGAEMFAPGLPEEKITATQVA